MTADLVAAGALHHRDWLREQDEKAMSTIASKIIFSLNIFPPLAFRCKIIQKPQHKRRQNDENSEDDDK